MHNHIDRDKYVEIHLENVDPKTRYNFDKVDSAAYGDFGTTYDLLSVMHYSSKAFSMNGLETIVPRNAHYASLIGAKKLSPNDVRRVNNMYECNESPPDLDIFKSLEANHQK